MGHALELDQRARGSIREGVWINRPRWSRSEEANPRPDLWTVLAKPVALRRSVARDFASAIGERPEVMEVWITGVENDLSLAVALNGSTTEIDVRTAFLDLVMERLSPQEGDLHIFPSGSVPDWVKRGERLA